jgi:cell division protein FtsN
MGYRTDAALQSPKKPSAALGRILVKAIAALAVGVALIALAAVVFLTPRPQAQTVALDPIEATPQRVDINDDNPQPAPPPPQTETTPVVKPTEPLEPRDTTATPPSPPTDDLPEPSERPTDVEEPSVSSNPSLSDSTSSNVAPSSPAVPSSLPVRQTAQGWGVQAGAFRTETNAVALRDRLLKAGLAARVESGDGGLYRVFVGAYANADAARASVPSVVAALR